MTSPNTVELQSIAGDLLSTPKSGGNMIQRLLENSSDLTCDQVLVLAMICLRGGTAHRDAICGDYGAWLVEHGSPTREKLGAWAATLDIEAGLAEPLVMAGAAQEES